MLSIEPIGVVHSPYQAKYDAPRQPDVDDRHAIATIELFAGRNYEQALADIEGFDRIWVLGWFHRATTWKPRVLVPRGRQKRGVFATRSPHRPNPISLTACTVQRVHGRFVEVASIDLLDQTPVLDLKPYVAYADAFPESRAGWLDDLPTTSYTVTIATGSTDHVPQDVVQHILRVLEHDPWPHPYRRIRQISDTVYEIAIRQWRATYTIESTSVAVHAITRLTDR